MSDVDNIRKALTDRRQKVASLKAEISALETALAILLGEEEPVASAGLSIAEQFEREYERLGVIENAIQVLQEAGKPLTTRRLLYGLSQRGIEPNKANVMPSIYREVRKNRTIVLIESGLFALKEWGSNPKPETDAQEG